VQYIHHLKENEARNIEKWTLEKLLMDQAMGDLQAQLEEMRRLWEEERAARTRAESELDVLRGLKGSSDSHAPISASAGAAPEKALEASASAAAAAMTSASEGETTQGGDEESGRSGKRQRTD
jgi:transcriptional regulator CBF1